MQPEDSLAEIETQDLNLGCIQYVTIEPGQIVSFPTGSVYGHM